MTAKNTRTVKVQTTARRSKAKSAAPNEDELHIHFPKDEDWKDLIKTLGLPKPKAKILMETLGDIVMDIAVIKKIKAKKIKKPDAIRRIENLELRLEQGLMHRDQVRLAPGRLGEASLQRQRRLGPARARRLHADQQFLPRRVPAGVKQPLPSE